MKTARFILGKFEIIKIIIKYRFTFSSCEVIIKSRSCTNELFGIYFLLNETIERLKGGNMKILLVCSAGMSTSLLVTKMLKAAAAINLEVDISAHSASEAKKLVKNADVVLLGPQVRFMKNEFIKLATVPVDVIDMMAYGRMDGEKVLLSALALLEK